MPYPISIPDHLDGFLRESAALSLEQWTTVYWRFAQDPSIQKACRKFANVALQAWLDDRNTMTEQRKAEASALSDQIAVRIHEVLGSLPEDELDPNGGRLRQRVQWILINTKTALINIELLRATPATRKAVVQFLTLFDGLISFPEYQS